MMTYAHGRRRDDYWCEPCQRWIEPRWWHSHVATARHQELERVT